MCCVAFTFFHAFMHTSSLLTFCSNRQSQPAIGSSGKGIELKWVRDQFGRLVRLADTPIQEGVDSESVANSMAERQNVENSQVEPNEPWYTRAEVELMINEMLA